MSSKIPDNWRTQALGVAMARSGQPRTCLCGWSLHPVVGRVVRLLRGCAGSKSGGGYLAAFCFSSPVGVVTMGHSPPQVSLVRPKTRAGGCRQVVDRFLVGLWLLFSSPPSFLAII